MIDYMEEKEMTLMFLLKDMEMILSSKGNVLLQNNNSKEDTIIIIDVNINEVIFRKKGKSLFLLGYNLGDSI